MVTLYCPHDNGPMKNRSLNFLPNQNFPCPRNRLLFLPNQNLIFPGRDSHSSSAAGSLSYIRDSRGSFSRLTWSVYAVSVSSDMDRSMRRRTSSVRTRVRSKATNSLAVLINSSCCWLTAKARASQRSSQRSGQVPTPSLRYAALNWWFLRSQTAGIG